MDNFGEPIRVPNLILAEQRWLEAGLKQVTTELEEELEQAKGWYTMTRMSLCDPHWKVGKA